MLLILFIYLVNLFIFIYLFLAALDLHCCAWAFSSAASGGYSLLPCAGFSLQWLLLLQSMGSRASVVVARGLSSCGSRALEHKLSSCGARA